MQVTLPRMLSDFQWKTVLQPLTGIPVERSIKNLLHRLAVFGFDQTKLHYYALIELV